MNPEELRDTVAQYWVAYYGEVNRILNTVSWGSAELPTHFIPQPRTIRLHQARDGFIVEHYNQDLGTGRYLAFEIYPPTERTVGELSGGSFDYTALFIGVEPVDGSRSARRNSVHPEH